MYMAIQPELTENQEDLGSPLRLLAPPSGVHPSLLLLLPVPRAPAPPTLPKQGQLLPANCPQHRQPELSQHLARTLTDILTYLM